jgi:transposase
MGLAGNVAASINRARPRPRILPHRGEFHSGIVWGDGNIHKGPVVRALCADFPRLHLEALPPYSPEVNPDEGVWMLAKGALANGRPDSRDSLRRESRKRDCERVA